MARTNDDFNKIADANVRTADTYFMNRDFNQAAEYYETAIALNKVDVDYSYYQKALCNGLLKNFQEKINDLKYIESHFPASNYLSAAISNLFSFLFVSGLKKYKPIQGSLVAKSMLDHAKSKIKGFQIIESDEMNT